LGAGEGLLNWPGQQTTTTLPADTHTSIIIIIVIAVEFPRGVRRGFMRFRFRFERRCEVPRVRGASVDYARLDGHSGICS